MKRKKNPVPRAALKSLAEDINRLVGTQEGKLFILETIEEIPFENRIQVLEGLSSFYSVQMVEFFHLLKWEYGKEMEGLCARALEKYSLAGMDINPPVPYQGEFYKAYASCSRHTGRITLDIAWQSDGKALQVECFYLTFNPDGIHSFFLLENIPVKQYENDRQLLPDMVEISFNECCFLIDQAYSFNIRNMTRPALGRFLYQKYLDVHAYLDKKHIFALMNHLSQKISPAQVVNSFFHAFKHHDFEYIESLVGDPGLCQSLLEENFQQLLKPGTSLLEGQIDQVYGSKESVWVQAFSTTVEESEFYRHGYKFCLHREDDGPWLLTDVRHISSEALNTAAGIDQRLEKIVCRVYDILDLDRLFDILDRIENIYEVEELPCGMHMRVSCVEDNLNQGVSFLSGVVADLIVNGEEFVLLSHKNSTLKDFEMLLGTPADTPVCLKGDYKIGLLTAYNFLRGRYLCFADALEDGEADSRLDDGLCFISTRYLIKDRENVLKRIGEVQTFQVKLAGECQVYYCYDTAADENGFFAEYIVGSNWLTLSTYGERDMCLARQNLENQMFDCLELDGMEIRDEGVFDILTAEVKKENPELEDLLKEIYLNKWSQSRLSTLSGMTPSEASQTEEGTRMLWALLKKMKQTGNKRYRQGRKRYIHLNEYIQKLQQKNERQ